MRVEVWSVGSETWAWAVLTATSMATLHNARIPIKSSPRILHTLWLEPVLMRRVEPQQPLRHPVIIVSQNIAFMHEVPGQRLNSQRPYPFQIRLDRLLPLACVLLHPFAGNRGRIDQRIVED